MIAVIYWTHGSGRFRLVNKPNATVEVRTEDELGATSWRPARDAKDPREILGIALGALVGATWHPAAPPNSLAITCGEKFRSRITETGSVLEINLGNLTR